MKIILSPEQSRAARRALGLTQNQLIEKSGLSGYKLKQFESGFADPEGVAPFLRELRDFYEAEGHEFIDAPEAAKERPAALQELRLPAILADDGLTQRTALICRHFFVDERISDNQIREAGERILESFGQAKELLGVKLETRFLSEAYDEETETKMRELWGHLARIGLVCLHMQGRVLVDQTRFTNPVPDDKPDTLGDLLFITYREALAGLHQAAQDEEVTAEEAEEAAA